MRVACCISKAKHAHAHAQGHVHKDILEDNACVIRIISDALIMFALSPVKKPLVVCSMQALAGISSGHLCACMQTTQHQSEIF